VTVVTLSAPSEGSSLYRTRVELTGLDASHAIYARETYDSQPFVSGPDGSGGTAYIAEIDTTVDSSDGPVAVEIKDGSGLSTSASWNYTVFELDVEAGDEAGTAGARGVTITVTDGTDAVPGASVAVRNGLFRHTATTNSLGIVTFGLDDATYTVSITKPGYSFAGATLVVDGDESETYEMSPIVISLPSGPTTATYYLTCYKSDGTPESGVTLSYRLEKPPAGTGASYNRDQLETDASAGNGVISVTILRNASYVFWRGANGKKVPLVTDSSATGELPTLLGSSS
jgi:hypothetical protein